MEVSDETSGRARITAVVLVLLLVSGAVVLTLHCGLRGFYPYDQSIVFDGAYRMYRGQMPFRDFVVPAGPTVFSLVALAFAVFGVSYLTYVAVAAVLAGIATGLAFALVRRIASSPRDLVGPLVAGSLTAVWSYAIYGTPWFENTASVLALGALWFSLPLGIGSATRERAASPTSSRGTEATGRKVEIWRCMGAGSLLALAFLSKQNAGLLAGALLVLPVFLASRISASRPWAREAASMIAGGLVVLGGWLAWIYVSAEPDLFWRYFWTIPSDLGGQRITSTGWGGLIGGIVWTIDPGLTGYILKGLLIAAVGVLWLGYRREMSSEQWVGATVVLGALFYQNAMALLTGNHGWNSYPFLGLILGSLFVCYAPFLRTRRWSRRAAEGAVYLATVLLLTMGVVAARDRWVQDPFADRTVTYRSGCDVPGLGALDWAQPTVYGGRELTCDDIERTLHQMGSVPGPTMVIGDLTIVHALAGEEPVSPLVWYHRGLTYERDHDDWIDRWLVQRLQLPDLRMVLVEVTTSSPVSRPMDDFPRFREALLQEFAEAGVVGSFRVFLRGRQGSTAVSPETGGPVGGKVAPLLRTEGRSSNGVDPPQAGALPLSSGSGSPKRPTRSSSPSR